MKRESYINGANSFLNEEEYVGQENVQLRQNLYKLVKENGSYDVLAELINVLVEEDPALANAIKDVVGPLPEE